MDLTMYTTEDVAKYLGTTRQTVEMLRQVGVLKAIKIGKRYMYPSDIISDFQRTYLGCDLSNRSKAIAAKELIDARN